MHQQRRARGYQSLLNTTFYHLRQIAHWSFAPPLSPARPPGIQCPIQPVQCPLAHLFSRWQIPRLKLIDNVVRAGNTADRPTELLLSDHIGRACTPLQNRGIMAADGERKWKIEQDLQCRFSAIPHPIRVSIKTINWNVSAVAVQWQCSVIPCNKRAVQMNLEHSMDTLPAWWAT